jgi:hypothetical protein
MRRMQGMRSWYGDECEQARRTADLWNLWFPVGTPIAVLSPEGGLLHTKVKVGATEQAGVASLFVDELGIWLPLRQVLATDPRHRALIAVHREGCCQGCGEPFADTATIAWRGTTPLLRCSCGHVEVAR